MFTKDFKDLHATPQTKALSLVILSWKKNVLFFFLMKVIVFLKDDNKSKKRGKNDKNDKNDKNHKNGKK